MTEISLRRQPVQGRSRASCAAIKEAAARILVAAGPGALNTNAIAECAGVSVGTLYQYYPAKEAIVADLVREMRAGMLADIERGAAEARGRNLRCAVRILVSASLNHHRVDAPRAEALERAEAVLPMDEETNALKQRIIGLVAEVLGRHGIADTALAARDLAALTRGMAQVAISAGETDFDALAARISRAAYGYLSYP